MGEPLASLVTAFIRIKDKGDFFTIKDNKISLSNGKNNFEFEFDKIFGQKTSNNQIYNEITKLNNNHNLTILAYGQTGSGKTFTINGNSTTLGLAQLILLEVLAICPVEISFIEIYNEKIYDLFDNKEKHLREFDKKNFIQDLISKPINKIEEYLEMSNLISRNRKTAETNLNAFSSRSHLIINIKSKLRTINLIDLAGSENNKRTGNQGERMKESLNINRSLFVLHKVVNSIVNKEKRIPFRDSKLTRLLQYPLSEGYVYLIATIIDSSDNIQEAINTLTFASKSKKIISNIVAQECTPKENTSGVKISMGDGKARFSRRKYDIPISPRIILPKTDRSKEIQRIPSATVESNQPKSNISPLNKKKPKICRLSSFDSSTLKQESNKIQMTPITKMKSKECFLRAALEFESIKDFKSALDSYKTLYKFAPDDDIFEKIKNLQKMNKKETKKYTKTEILKILNSGSFLDLKKLSGIGDKKAQIISDFIQGGNMFECIEDLKMIFKEGIVKMIMENLET